MLRILTTFNPTIWKKLISALKNAAAEVTSFEERISKDFEELPENGKCHQRLVRESRGKLPDPLLAEKKALAADLKTNGTVRQITHREAQGLFSPTEDPRQHGGSKVLLRALHRPISRGALSASGNTAGS